MAYRIRRAAVLGAGTMGAAIAAHLANAGIPVLLLDIVPRELTEEEKKRGLTLQDREVRNRIARQGLERALKARPAAFFTPERAELVEVGNVEDDLPRIAEVDWVIEAVIERLDIKRQVMARVEALRGPHTIVSTNTSGIPLAQIAEGRSPEFQKHFLGTHFFNPPRYLKLVELIPGPGTDPELLKFMHQFLERDLGKRVVPAKDTPNFIANRLFSVHASFTMAYALEHGYTVEEVDALTGPLIGRPKTATFRLNDLVGIDVMDHVGRNLYAAIPHDEMRDWLVHPKLVRILETLLERKWLGNKAGVGFYKKVQEGGKKEYWALDLETLEHRPPQKPRFDSVKEAKGIEDLGERLRFLVAQEDRAGTFVRAVLYNLLSYAALRIPEIADTPLEVDRAIRWGFAHEMGPFEVWDALGVAETVERMEKEGFPVAGWVKEMLAAGHTTFYRRENGRVTAVYKPEAKEYVPVPEEPRYISIAERKAAGKVLEENAGASLIDLGDGVLLLEFHTKMNALDEDIFRMWERALDRLEAEDWVGMVIGNQGPHFCAGANIFVIAAAAQAKAFDQIDQAVRLMQRVVMRTRYSPKPVVAAPFGMVLGGGAEVAMSAARIVASAETYMGLVEVGVGLIPAGGGIKEMLRRVLNPVMETRNADVLPVLQRLFETIGMAKVSASAEEARKLGFLTAADRIVMNPDALLYEAKVEVLRLAEDGYRPPLKAKIYAAGRDAFAALKVGLFQMVEARQISEHDAKIGEKLAYALCGGDLSQPAWVPEEHILDLEREGFLSLCGEEKTLQRLWHMLQTGKPLRN